MKKLSIKPKIRLESFYTRRLHTVRQLEPFLKSVENFKAIKKFHDLFYKKPESKNDRKYVEELRITEFSYYISDRYQRIDFTFSRWVDSKKDYELNFEIKEKSIPAIAAGLAEYKQKLLTWQKDENKNCKVNGYTLSHEIEKAFNENEMTEEQFFARRRSMAKLLLEYSKQVAGAMPGKAL